MRRDASGRTPVSTIRRCRPASSPVQLAPCRFGSGANNKPGRVHVCRHVGVAFVDIAAMAAGLPVEQHAGRVIPWHQLGKEREVQIAQQQAPDTRSPRCGCSAPPAPDCAAAGSACCIADRRTCRRAGFRSCRRPHAVRAEAARVRPPSRCRRRLAAITVAPVTGRWIQLATNSPPRARQTITANSFRPSIKLVVPSIGSMIQTGRSPLSRSSSDSDPRPPPPRRRPSSPAADRPAPPSAAPPPPGQRSSRGRPQPSRCTWLGFQLAEPRHDLHGGDVGDQPGNLFRIGDHRNQWGDGVCFRRCICSKRLRSADDSRTER